MFLELIIFDDRLSQRKIINQVVLNRIKLYNSYNCRWRTTFTCQKSVYRYVLKLQTFWKVLVIFQTEIAEVWLQNLIRFNCATKCTYQHLEQRLCRLWFMNMLIGIFFITAPTVLEVKMGHKLIQLSRYWLPAIVAEWRLQRYLFPCSYLVQRFFPRTRL